MSGEAQRQAEAKMRRSPYWWGQWVLGRLEWAGIWLWTETRPGRVCLAWILSKRGLVETDPLEMFAFVLLAISAMLAVWLILVGVL